MEVHANREFGRIMHGLVRGRMLERGIVPAPFTVEPLGEYLDTLATLMRRHMSRYYRGNSLEAAWHERFDDPGFRLSIHWDPTMQLGLRVFLLMVWTSLLVPDRFGLAAQVVPHIDEFFEKFHYRPIDDEEATALQAEIAALMGQPRAMTSLGAAGSALLSTTNRHLRRVPSGKSQQAIQRRRAFIETARRICLTIENATDLATRKAEASLLGEKLAAELDASHCRADFIVGRFWQEFDLFFSGTTLAQ